MITLISKVPVNQAQDAAGLQLLLNPISMVSVKRAHLFGSRLFFSAGISFSCDLGTNLGENEGYNYE